MEKRWGITKTYNGGLESWHGKGDNADVLSSILDLDIEKLKQAISGGKELNTEIIYTKDDIKISGTPLYFLLSTKPMEPENRTVATELPVEKTHDALLYKTVYEKVPTKEDFKKAEKKNIERTATVLEMAELLLDNGAKFKTSDKNFKIKLTGLQTLADRVK